MNKMLFKNRKVALGFVAFTIISVVVLFSGDNSIVSRLMSSFGDHPEVSADGSVATESVHPAEIPIVAEQPQADDGDQGFVDDDELVEDGEGSDPTPPEESIGNDSDDGGSSAEDDGYNGEQVIIVNPGAPQAG